MIVGGIWMVIIGFVGLSDTKLVKFSSQNTASRTHTRTSVLSYCIHQSSGNDFQRRPYPFLSVPELFSFLIHSISRVTEFHTVAMSRQPPKLLNYFKKPLTSQEIFVHCYKSSVVTAQKAPFPIVFFYFLQIYNLLYKLSNKQIRENYFVLTLPSDCSSTVKNL
jgi:hypothetical protein